MYLGVEIGGTKLQVGVCDRRGRIAQLVRVAVVRRDGARGILKQLEKHIPPLLAKHRVRAIGVGFGGPVDAFHGRVVKSFHINGWEGFALRRWFVQRFHLQTVIENDTNVAALAEARIGAGKGRRAVLYSNVGTGIGGGFVVDGKIHNGRFGATEIGHTIVTVRKQGRLRHQIVESVASGLSIERGKTTLAESAKYYGVALANAITLLNPDIVVVGGGVTRAGEKFLRPVRETAKRFVFGPYRRNFRIVRAALGDTVVVAGGALLAAGEA
jgi:glucokinase